MPTPLLRDVIGSNVVVTAANAVANNAYANAADKLTINNTGLALLADFRLTSATFATAPVGGALQLFAVDRDFSGNAGPTPSATMPGRLVGSFSPYAAASNTATSWVMSLNSVPLSAYTDYWLMNNGTAYSLNSGWVLTAQLWSPGT
ncbi:MAG: hypothetical protein Q7U28_08210 [Aquabacterium sp.]|nr:hypothetical protein [Aquabacterium sp.]